MEMAIPNNQQSASVNDRAWHRLAAIGVRGLIVLGIAIAFTNPFLPNLGKLSDLALGQENRSRELPVVDFPLERLSSGVCRIDVSSLRLRDLADDSDNPNRSDVQLLEDGEPLTPHATTAQIATTAGSFRHWKHQVDFHPRDNTAAPAAYQLRIPQYSSLGAFLRGRAARTAFKSLLLIAVFGSAALFGYLLIVRSSAAASLLRCDDIRTRCTLAGIVALGLAVALAPNWNRIVIEPDSKTYFDQRAIRAPLYPLYLRLWHPADLSLETNAIYVDPNHPLIPAIRATKVLWLVSIVFFLWMLSRQFSPWLLSIVFGWILLAYIDRYASSQLAWMDHLLTEPLNYSLTFLLCGVLVAYLTNRRYSTAIALSGTVSLLLLLRPSNLPLIGVAFVIAAVEWRQSGLRIAIYRTALAIAVAFLFVPLQMAANCYNHGKPKSPPFTGHCLASFAIQFASADDANAIADPKIRSVLLKGLDKYGSKRTEKYLPGGESLDVNLWSIAVPALHEVYGADVDDFTADHVLGTMARTIIGRRPEMYRGMVMANLQWFWQWPIHCPLLLTVLLSVAWASRGGATILWLTAFLGVMPFLNAVLTSILARPHERYMSQFAFAEYAVPLLFLAVAGIHHWSQNARRATCSLPCAPTTRVDVRQAG